MGRCDVREGGGVKGESYEREGGRGGGGDGEIYQRGAGEGARQDRASGESDGRGRLRRTPFAGRVLGRLIERCPGRWSNSNNEEDEASQMMARARTLWPDKVMHGNVN